MVLLSIQVVVVVAAVDSVDNRCLCSSEDVSAGGYVVGGLRCSAARGVDKRKVFTFGSQDASKNPPEVESFPQVHPQVCIGDL